VSNLLLDTDACVEIIRGNPAPLEAFPGASFAISVVSRFEIRSGLRGRSSTKRERRAVAFLDTVNTFSLNSKAADYAAQIRIDLETRGEGIGAYDTLLAGHALALNMPLLTGNTREFQRVVGLELRTWK
jgi:tRNA(fMet)-specific endonuclease VapC